MVKVYSITTCPWCDKVKKYLKSKNVAYEEHNIELSEADRDEPENFRRPGRSCYNGKRQGFCRKL